jgi:hypothetical protein
MRRACVPGAPLVKNCFQLAKRSRVFVSTIAPFSMGGRFHRRGRSLTQPAPWPLRASRLFAARIAKQMCLCHCQCTAWCARLQ